jgi:hypothetical protein
VAIGRGGRQTYYALLKLLSYTKVMPVQIIAAKHTKARGKLAKKGQQAQMTQMGRAKQWRGLGNRESSIHLDFSKSSGLVQI